MDIREAAQTVAPQVVQWRRHLHRHPELSWEEVKTQAWLKERLEEMDLEPRVAGGTGLIVDIAGAKPGPTIALRADIDALAVQEETGLDYASTVPGKMHACGHDAHAAMLLGAAKVLAENRDAFAGTVRLLFQPAEETAPPHVKRLADTGATAMVDDGAMDGVDKIFGMHIFSFLPIGLIDLTPGPVMAGSCAFDVTITGQGGHAGLPQGTVDALAVAAHLVVALRSATTLGSDPINPRVVHIGRFAAGSARTAVAETASLEGTIRYLEKSVLVEMKKKVEQTAAGVAAAFGAQAEVTFGDRLNKPVVNNEALTEKLRPLAREVVGEHGVIARPPVMGAEDFSVYLRRAPGVFIALGGGNPAKRPPAGHHSPHFWLDEDAFVYGVEMWLRIAVELS